MFNQFDYQADEMDERVTVMPIPRGLNPSLNTSRLSHQNLSSHRKILEDLQIYIQESKNKENERIKGLKEKQKKLGEYMTKQQEHKEMKRREIQEEQREKLLKQCTFKPKINEKNGPKRNFNEFLDNQYAHTQKVKDKCEQLKKNIEDKKQKATHKPKINNSSRRKESSESNTVFERLYSLSEKERIQQGESTSFQPAINPRSKNLVRDGPVQHILYEDAKRRQEKGQQMQFLQSNSVMEKNQKTVNYNNEKYAAQKFIREYFFTLEALEVQTSFQAGIEYVVFNELLKKLGFVTNEQELQTKASSAERALVHDAYQLLEATRVNARNVCVFLLGLIGIYHINPVNFDEGDQPEPEKQFNLDQIEGRKLQKQFNLFYRNRLSSESTRKAEERNENENYSFQPSINKQSVEMAEKYRNTMLEEANQLLQEYPQLEFKIPEDGVISHTELLVLNKMAKDLRKERKKEEREDDELKECTFKPMTMNQSLGCSKTSEHNPNAGYKKSTELYEYFKQIKSRKDSLQISRHNEADPECTFKPQINKTKPPKIPQVPFSKQTDETLYRLHKGRQEHEEKAKFFERGEKLRSRKSLTKEAEMPTLILDVNLGEKSDRIVLYRGDEDRLEEVAGEFGKKHGLDEESEGKLLSMLKTELENVLLKIDENSESDQLEN